MTTSPPLFSIITVARNAEATIPATLRSVAEQTWRDFEYLVVDGASTDRTVELAQQAGIAGASITSEPDSGIYDAMNKGLARAKGRYVMFLNAGDAFHSSESLSLIAGAVNANDYPGIVYGQTDIVNSKRQRLAPRHLSAPRDLTLDSFSDGMVVCHQAFVALRDLTPFFNTAYRFSADYEWCIKCLQHSRRNILVDEVIIDYLDEGATTANRRKSLIERFKIMCRYYGVSTTVIKHLEFLPRFIRRNKLEKNFTQ